MLDRVVGLRRSHAARAEVEAENGAGDDWLSLEELQERVERLESLVEQLQDAVHRRAVRHNDELVELRRKTDPGALAQALAEHARERGL